MFKSVTLISIIIVALLACKNDKKQPRVVIENPYLKEEIRFVPQFHPIRMWANDSSIYFSDTPQNTISVYSHEGVLRERLGKSGPAPWENGTVWHFALDEIPNYYWVQDYPKQLIKKIDAITGNLVASMKIIAIDNVQYIENGRFVVPNMDEKTGVFRLSIYDVNKQVLIKHIDVSEMVGIRKPAVSDRLDFVLNGNMCTNNTDAIHFCYNSGALFKINKKTLAVSFIKEVRGYDLPKAVVEYGGVRIKPKLVMVSSAAMDSSHLYMLTSLNGNFAKTDKFFIDMYNLTTDTYQHSFSIPVLSDEQRPVYIVVVKQKLIVYFENGTVVIYRKNG